MRTRSRTEAPAASSTPHLPCLPAFKTGPLAPKGIFFIWFLTTQGFVFIFSFSFIFGSSVFKQTGRQRVGLDGRLRPGQ